MINQKSLLDKMIEAANHISKTSTRGSGSYIIMGSEDSNRIYDEYLREEKVENRNKKIDDLLMDKQLKYDKVYLEMAKKWSELSHCSRKKVGALIVKNGMIISDGFNGTPSGHDNVCETDLGDTHWYVIHAECNAILKCAKWGNSCEGATIYQTHSPCKECSKLILQSGISRLVYSENYKDLSGVDFLKDSGIKVDKILI
jgi:dCMP deaminase